jgi:serine/threonine protein kinase/Tol biopolymer transport system component
MALAPGTRLGPYEILAPLGVGGMGEVYRARDTRLERTVAIKILPAQFSCDPVRKQRFEREAKTISSLNHPHICVLYDVGNQDGVEYLVMECIEGETLAKRLEKGPVTLDQVLKYGAQIADALDKAHQNGVIHRDLKPGNIMLTTTGAKLLDFGLARPTATPATLATMTAMAPAQSPMTQEGTIVGTFQYMSPEQVEGKELDGRSDIFSLGAVLYEMLTGRKAFEGKGQLSVVSAILEKELQAISLMKPLTPPVLEHAIQRCLAKNPEERWQRALDLGLELKWLAESGSGLRAPTPPQRLRAGWDRLAWALAASMALLVALLTFPYLKNKQSSEAHAVRFTISPPQNGAYVFNGVEGGAALSPDGRSVAFIARVDRVTLLWVRALDAFASRPLPGTEGVVSAFWSPDSSNLGFFTQDKLKRIATSGGPAQILCEVHDSRGGSWGPNDVILFARVVGGIYRVAASGGVAERVTTLNAGRLEVTHRWPFFLPDGKHFFFMASPLGNVSPENSIYVASLDGKSTKFLFHGSSPIVYAMGHVLYIEDKVLMARPFDAKKLDFIGDAVPLAENIQFNPIISNGVFSASQNGMLLYQQGSLTGSVSLVMFDREGRQLSSIGDPGAYTGPRLSPDGKRLLYVQIDPRGGKRDVWIHDLTSDQLRLVASNQRPLGTAWSPDGQRFAYSGVKGNAPAIYVKPANTVGAEQEIWGPTDSFVFSIDWTSDGKFLIFTELLSSTGKSRIAKLPTSGNAGPTPVLEAPGVNFGYARVSPDGKWIAYRADESGTDEIYVSSFPNPVGKLQVSVAGGSMPCWRGDGKELYYLAPDNKLMAAEMKEANGLLQVVATKTLFQTAAAPTRTGGSPYDVTPDGKRFLVDTQTSDQTSALLNVVENWAEEFRKK